jgi:hypothetical protein
MIRRTLVLSLVVLLCTVWLSALGFSQQARKKRPSRAKATAVVAAPGPEYQPKLLVPGHVPVPAVPKQQLFLPSPAERLRSLPVKIRVHPDLKGPVAKLHGEAARLLATAGGPEADAAWSHRVNHFTWLSRNNNYSITGWGGFIDGLEPTADGMMVSLRMVPTFTVQGSSATTPDYLIEKYLIANSQVRYMHSIVPPLALSDSVMID